MEPVTLTGRRRRDYLVLVSGIMRKHPYMQWLHQSYALVSAWQERDQETEQARTTTASKGKKARLSPCLFGVL